MRGIGHVLTKGKLVVDQLRALPVQDDVVDVTELILDLKPTLPKLLHVIEIASQRLKILQAHAGGFPQLRVIWGDDIEILFFHAQVSQLSTVRRGLVAGLVVPESRAFRLLLERGGGVLAVRSFLGLRDY